MLTLVKLKQIVEILIGRELTKPRDMEDDFFGFYQTIRPYTMTRIERAYALYQSCKYVAQRKIPGDFVECGVWRGGSAMLAALTWSKYCQSPKDLWLYDTFAGMSMPGCRDRYMDGNPAPASWQGRLAVSLDEVRLTMRLTGYPEEHIHFVEGKVEQTLPERAPDRIAVLRLDTDWYESTLWELEHLYPRLSSGGVLIIDDYGHWQGAREATDEYFSQQPALLLHRIDYAGRLGIKPRP